MLEKWVTLMAKKKKKVKMTRRMFFFGLPCIGIIGLLVFTIGGYWFQIYQKYQEKKFLDEQLVELKKKEEELKVDVEKLQDPDYIARFARENYLYSKNGEYIIKIQGNDKTTETTDIDHEKSIRYIVIGVGSFLTILGIYVLRHMTK